MAKPVSLTLRLFCGDRSYRLSLHFSENPILLKIQIWNVACRPWREKMLARVLETTSKNGVCETFASSSQSRIELGFLKDHICIPILSYSGSQDLWQLAFHVYIKWNNTRSSSLVADQAPLRPSSLF
jgi:hypothetical protein